MKYTCNIKKAHFFIDQIEELGKVSLSQAIKIFQNFPFKDQFKEVNNRELTSCFPTISFNSEDGKVLIIWAKNDKGFFIHYDNGNQVSNFYLSYDFEINPQGITVEEYIDFFFKQNIESKLKLTNKNTNIVDEEDIDNDAENEIQKVQSDIITFSFSNTKKINSFLWILPFLAISCYIFKIDFDNNFDLGLKLHLLLSLLWLPTVIIHITYWLKNRDSVVIIDIKEKRLIYKKGTKIINFNREEIDNCEINKSSSRIASWGQYCYILIVLKDKRQIVITNFITEPNNIINSLNLNYKVDIRIIPFLPL